METPRVTYLGSNAHTRSGSASPTVDSTRRNVTVAASPSVKLVRFDAAGSTWVASTTWLAPATATALAGKA